MSQRYNIAIIAGQLVVGGAERQLYLWLSHLDRNKFRPVVVTLHPGCGDYWEDSIESLDIPLLRVPRRRSRLMRLITVVQALRPYEPKLIHGWHLFSSPYAGVAAKLLGAKSLGSLRCDFRNFSNKPQLAIPTLYLVDALLANSYSAGEQLSAVRKLRKQKVHIVQNAVVDQIETDDRLTLRKKISQQLGISQTGMWLGSLGRLDHLKRFDLLLKAVAFLLEDRQDFQLILIGDGPARTDLEKMVDSIGITKYVTFAGEVPGASAWLSALDIFCFTSLDEGLPNAVMEAAVAEVPIVAWRVPFTEELLEDGKLASLVEPEDLIGFKDALLDLIQSPELRKKLGRAGRNHVLERFALNRFVQQMTSVYDDLLDNQQISDSGES